MQVRDLRNSERRDLKRCPQRWHWGWNDQLTPIRTNTKLWMGIGFHEGLAAWYLKGKRRGPHPAETWQLFCKEAGNVARGVAQPAWEDEEIEWQDAVDLGTYVLEQYVEKYGKDSKFHFLATERTFQMPIQKNRTPLARLVGTWDGVYRDLETGELWLIEHKSAAAGGSTRFIKFLPLDDQTNTYFMSATHILRKEGVLKDNEQLAGINFNFLEKYMPKPDDRPTNEEGLRLNKDGSVSKNQPKDPAQYFKREPAWRSEGDLKMTYTHLQDEATVRQAYLDGLIPLVKNPTFDCSWDCNFYRLCQLHESGDDWEEYRDLAYHTKEDRYADHNNRKKA